MEFNYESLNMKFNKICFKFAKIIRALDGDIKKNLKAAGYETRPVESNGIWCCLLLPVVLIMNTFLQKISISYQITTFIAVGLMFYSMLFIIFLSISTLILREPIYGGCTTCSLLSTILITVFGGQGVLVSLAYSLPCVYFFHWLLKTAIVTFPKTFTIGEAMIVSQSITLFIFATTVKFVHDLMDNVDDEMAFVNTIVFTALSTLGLIVTAIFRLTDENKNVKTLAYIIAAGATFALAVLHLILGVTFLFRFISFILMDKLRVKLFITWLALFTLAVLMLCIRTNAAQKANSVTRKTFHILAALVFLIGILTDVVMMTLVSGGALTLIILVEALRKSGIEPISSALQSAFLVYSDEKDSGAFAMTPMYLFAGLSCPLVLVPHTAKLELLSGVLALGAGDTAASCGGNLLGRRRWAGTSRTREGTACNILSQVILVYILEVFDLLQTKNALIRTIIAATISALFEAKTVQVDNLILPLVTILAFQATSFLS